MREDSARFARGENDRKLRWPGNTLDVVNEVEFSFEHLLVKKQQCAESLVLSGCGDALFNGEMSEKFGDFFLAHFLGVTFAMKQDVTTDPLDMINGENAGSTLLRMKPAQATKARRALCPRLFVSLVPASLDVNSNCYRGAGHCMGVMRIWLSLWKEIPHPGRHLAAFG